jgi:hypothetical protein
MDLTGGRAKSGYKLHQFPQIASIGMILACRGSQFPASHLLTLFCKLNGSDIYLVIVQCIFPQYALKFITTPFFILNSAYDVYQVIKLFYLK